MVQASHELHQTIENKLNKLSKQVYYTMCYAFNESRINSLLFPSICSLMRLCYDDSTQRWN